MPARLLLTGAAGQVATLIRPLLRDTFRAVRLSDIRPVTPEGAGEEFVHADLADADAVSEAVRGVDGIVHLGAIAKEAPYDELMPANVDQHRAGSYAATLRYARRRFAKDPIAQRLRGGVFASTRASHLR
jgi:nucleoside-diphosphate-sugar epimerase